MDRKEKIELLKGVATGRRSISELEPLTFEVWMCTDAVYYVNPKTGASIPTKGLILLNEFEKTVRKTRHDK